MQKITLLYVPAATKAEARRIAKHLLKKKLIACANIFPIESLYLWKGKIADSKEVVLLAKTLPENLAKVKKEIEQRHSYKIPCILKIPVEVNAKYFQWLQGELNTASK